MEELLFSETSYSLAEQEVNVPASEFCGLTGGVPRFGTAAAIAALRTWLKAGFIPHVRHGGRGNAEVAVRASKFDGTGFENEHIKQTHVPDDCLLDGAGRGVNGLLERETGDEEDNWYGRDRGFSVLDAMRSDPRPFLSGLGYNVILAEDLRNPALRNQRLAPLLKTQYSNVPVLRTCPHL